MNAISDLKMSAIDLRTHYYLPDYHLIVNKELSPLLASSLGNLKKTIVHKKDYSIESLKQEIVELNQVTLEVTQNCNLRCRYCLYNGHYFYHRDRAPISMTYDTGCTALNYFYSLVKDRPNKSLTISFYGGEPLLAFDLIQRLVHYAKSLFNRWTLTFGITTNGTLISDPVVDFLVENNIKLIISLDGPKHIHDGNRPFSNGKGSYDRIFNNLCRLKSRAPDYYGRHVGFSIVWCFDSPLKELSRYFNKDIFDGNKLYISEPLRLNNTFYQGMESHRLDAVKDFQALIKSIESKRQKHKRLSRFEEVMYTDAMDLMLRQKHYNIFFTTCLFNERLFVDSNGNIHICHMINNKFPIGNVTAGLDYERIQKICKEYTDIVSNYCLACEVRFLCQRCYVVFAQDWELRMQSGMCEFQKKDIHRKLARFVSRNEKVAS